MECQICGIEVEQDPCRSCLDYLKWKHPEESREEILSRFASQSQRVEEIA